MPDNKKIRNPLDNKRIDINDPDEVRNWCKSLNCSEADLIEAVDAVGTYAEKVRKYLEQHARVKLLED